MSNFIKRPTMSEQRKSKPWTLKDVVEHYGSEEGKKLIAAKSYINYGIKEGYFEQEQFVDMTDQELIEFAAEEQVRSDLAYESYREDDGRDVKYE